MWDPQVRFCERPGGESPRAYSTRRDGRLARVGAAHALSPDAHGAHPGLCSLGDACAPASMPSLVIYAGSQGTGNPSRPPLLNACEIEAARCLHRGQVLLHGREQESRDPMLPNRRTNSARGCPCPRAGCGSKRRRDAEAVRWTWMNDGR